MLSVESRYARAPEVVAADMDGETVMMHIDKGAYFSLNGTGSLVWEALAAPITLPGILAQVRQHYDTGAVPNLTEEVTAFVEDLLANDLISRAD